MKLGELLPDQPARDNPGLVRAEGCLPGALSYEPFPDAVIDATISANILQVIRGGAMLYDSGGTRHKMIGGEFSIQEGDDYASSFGSYGGLALDWYFVAWGDDFYAVNQWDVMQSGTMGAGTVAAVTGAPRAHTLDVVRDFIMAGRDIATSENRIVSWCALGDPTDWAPSITTQAGNQILNDVGAVQRVIGGEYATIFCERAIYRATYIGPPIIWQFDRVESGRGAFDDSSVIKIGELIYFLDPTGFFVFDGTQSLPISSEKISQTFFDDFDRSNNRRISVAADLKNTRIFWWYRDKSAVQKCMVYNWATKRWTGPTVLNAGFAMWDDEFDAMSIFNVDTTSDFYTLTGNPLQATIETGEEAGNPGGQTVVNGLRPVVDGDAPVVTAALGSRDSTSGAVTWTADEPINADTGYADVRSQARYHRALIKVSGDYTHISAVEPQGGATGGR